MKNKCCLNCQEQFEGCHSTCVRFAADDLVRIGERERIRKEDVVERENIKLLGEEHRKFREGITDEKVLIGYNMAIAICNKYLGESEDKE